MGTLDGPQSLLYPLSLHMQGRRAVVVGGGAVALRRVAGLRAAEADVLVIAPRLSPALADLASRGLITVRYREYAAGDLEGAWLVLACTDRPEVNAAIAAEAEHQRIWCVRADDATASTAWVPAVGRSAGVTVAVNAGRNPRRAALLRDRCLVAVEAAARPATQAASEPGRAGTHHDARTSGDTSVAPGGGGDRQAGGNRQAAPGGDRQAAPPDGVGGTVYVVGGGPGDPGLITVAGLRLLRAADVVVADRLAPLELLADLPDEVLVIDAAKVPRGPGMLQEEINKALVEHARAGRTVVRLKGGDPFVFGRGREEVEACLAAGVPVTIVPGVTSAVAVPAAAGIPVTHRGLSQGFCVVAGHASPTDPRSTVDWASLARSGMTLVLLMAIEHLADTARALLAAGLNAGTPCACVADGWMPHQRVVTASLRDIAAEVSGAGIVNPAVIVIGEVAQFATGTAASQRTGPHTATPHTATPHTATPHTATPHTATSYTGALDAADRAHITGPAANGPARGGSAPTPRGRRVFVLGGARSGKSAVAEGMLDRDQAADYIATGGPPGNGDAEWDARLRQHQARRPQSWHTLETLALDRVLCTAGTQAPVLVDCLTAWLSRVMDECGVWDGHPGAEAALADRVERLVHAWQATRRHVIAVSSEIGSGVVPETASGRRFRDELGRLNARIAAGSDEVWLCTAGIPRRLR